MSELLHFEGITEASFSVDEQRRTMTALVVPWGKIGKHSNGRTWRFARGSLKYADAKYVRLNHEHVQSARLGRAISAEDTDEGLVMTFRVYDGREGDKALALAADGVKTGFSVEIEADLADTEPDPENPGVLLVNMAHLTMVGFVQDPAFNDSRLISVRASIHDGTPMPDDGTQPTQPGGTPSPAPTSPAPAPEPAPQPHPQPDSTPAPQPEPVQPATGVAQVAFSQDQFLEFMNRFGQPIPTPEVRPVVDPTAGAVRPAATAQVTEPLAYAFSRQGPGRYTFTADTEHDFSTDLFALAANGREGRDYSSQLARLDDFIRSSFADVDTADVPGTLTSVRRPEMWVPQRDYATPLWDLTGRGPTPEGGRKFDIPKFTSASGLVQVATEKVEPAPGAFVDELQTITPGQLWGKVEITRQVWRQGGNPALSGILWAQMVRAFYEAREAAIATFLNTLTAATDIALTGSPATPTNDNDQTTVNDLETALADLQFARGGNRFTAMAVHQALYRLLARVDDDMGRPLYPMMAPSNANGMTAPLYKTIDIGGTIAVPAYALGTPSNASTNSWLFDPAVVMAWANAPERLFWDFGATVQTASNIPQLSFVTLGLYADYAVANTDISGVRQITFDPNTAA